MTAPLLTAREVAERLSVSYKTVTAMVGVDLPAINIGSAARPLYRFEEHAVDAYLADRRIVPKKRARSLVSSP